MIINCDAKALEWVGGAYLSQDKVAYEEIWNNVDQHTLNQIFLKLPGWEDAQTGIKSDTRALGRLIAKTFVFRLMYGGSAYSYANDPNFYNVSDSEKYWQNVIDTFYNKYQGLAQWHMDIVKEAVTTGQLTMPTGRICRFEMKTNYKGEKVAPETLIKNYPVQGLGADIMSVIRVEFAKRFKYEKINGLLINTVHDSIVCDTHHSELDRVAHLFNSVFADGPKLFEARFGKVFNLPLQCEIGFGQNMKELEDYKIA